MDWIMLLTQAETGDNVAQYAAAYYYDWALTIGDVEIVAEDKLKAFEWYQKAYKNGNDDAIIRTADFLSEGVYCEQNVGLAIELYERAIDNGSGLAAGNLAIIYRDEQDYHKAFKLYTEALNLDKSNSLNLALCCYFGIGTEKNMEKSLEILLKISTNAPEFNNCQYDVDEANYLLGKIYLDGELVEKSIPQARHFLKLADADNDHRPAQQLLMIIGRNDLSG